MDKVLVTGAGGFIGSHLVEALVRRGESVRAFVHYRGDGRRGWLESCACRDELEVVAGDVRDLDSLQAAARGCKQLFHLAALIAIPHSYTTPLAYLRTNTLGTYNALECARQQDLERVILASTSETYGTPQSVPIREDHPPAAQSPYAASKVGADQLALSYHRAFGTPVHIVRPFNTYGPRQSARAIIPAIAVQLLSGATRLRLGNLSPTRDLTFVEDTVAGFLAVRDAAALRGRPVHVGSDMEISIGDLARLLGRLCGLEVELTTEPERTRPPHSEVDRLRCDATLLRTTTAWRPRVGLEEGLRRTLDWLRQNLASYDPARYAR
ncbi:MAG TPA: GDP-mannose 4,6-dehydratase [Myxococcota bacterium]|nr:GDP-mannose 4,6-dehydratase [Myxococcota bacterium]HRY94344.1 GDP-mannose 4,6-dehydratase [Myxococcota bacterium]HSA22099.1 GDP-mannose 4,6-dehydratase [Myxococcota bacterium]